MTPRFLASFTNRMQRPFTNVPLITISVIECDRIIKIFIFVGLRQRKTHSSSFQFFEDTGLCFLLLELVGMEQSVSIIDGHQQIQICCTDLVRGMGKEF